MRRDHNHITFKTVLKNVNKQIICNTHWEVFLSRQMNYNQVVVKCQILQECFLQNFKMQKFQNMEHSNSRTFQGLSGTFKDLLCFQGLSRAWNFFSKIQGLSRTSQGHYEPCSKQVDDVVWNQKDSPRQIRQIYNAEDLLIRAATRKPHTIELQLSELSR